MLPCKAFTHMEDTTGATRAYRHQCLDGAPWAKLTVVVSNEPAISEVQGFCQGGHDHIVLEGRDPQGVAWTKRASSYWPPFARKVIKPLTRGLDIRRDTTSNWRAGFTGIDLGYTAVDLLRMAQYRPSRGKDIQAVARHFFCGATRTESCPPAGARPLGPGHARRSGHLASASVPVDSVCTGSGRACAQTLHRQLLPAWTTARPLGSRLLLRM